MATIMQDARMAEMRIRDVPDHLRKAFKIACAEEDISMNQKLIELMRKYLEKRGKLS
jgi:plasmid stability protein